MKPSKSLTDGYRELLFGQWMPNLLYEHYEADECPLVEKLWNSPVSPSVYLESDSVLSTRWLVLMDSFKEQTEWIPPFFQLAGHGRDPFHPVCRFYDSIAWCENRMIIHAITEWQGHLELTILKYELITLQNQLLDFLRECNNRLSVSKINDARTGKKLARYLDSLVRDSILILLHEINERFGYLLEGRGVDLQQIYIKHLNKPVPSEFNWFSTPDRVLWRLERMNQNENTDSRIEQLLNDVKTEYRQQTSGEPRQLLLNSIHILENRWFYGMIEKADKVSIGAVDFSKPARLRDVITEWKELLLLNNPGEKKENAVNHQEIFHQILKHSAEILNVLETKNESLSAAAEFTLLIDELFTEGATAALPGMSSQKVNTASGSDGHWLLNQYIPLDQVQEKLNVTSRTMRTYIGKYELPVREITGKSKWIRADDFEAFMEQFKKKKGTSS